jgi:hypothetical protein
MCAAGDALMRARREVLVLSDQLADTQKLRLAYSALHIPVSSPLMRVFLRASHVFSNVPRVSHVPRHSGVHSLASSP